MREQLKIIDVEPGPEGTNTVNLRVSRELTGYEEAELLTRANTSLYAPIARCTHMSPLDRAVLIVRVSGEELEENFSDFEHLVASIESESRRAEDDEARAHQQAQSHAVTQSKRNQSAIDRINEKLKKSE